MREYYEAVLEDLKRVKLQTEQAIEALEKLADLHGPRVQAAPSKLMAAAYPAAYDAPVSNKQAFQEAYAGTGFPPAPRRFDYPQYKEEQAEKKKAAAPIPADPAPSTARPDTQNNLEPESPIS